MNNSISPSDNSKNDSFDKEMKFILNIRAVFEVFLVVLAVGIWLLSLLAGDFYFGRVLSSFYLPSFIKCWIIPALIILIPVIGLWIPLYLYCNYESKAESSMPVHLKESSVAKTVRNALVMLAVFFIVVMPFFLALVINSFLGSRASKFILGGVLVIVFVILLRNFGFFRRVKTFIKK